MSAPGESGSGSGDGNRGGENRGSCLSGDLRPTASCQTGTGESCCCIATVQNRGGLGGGDKPRKAGYPKT